MSIDQQPSLERLGIAREGSRLRKVMIATGVLAAAALVLGIATGYFQLFAFILAMVAMVVLSWMWSVAVDRAYHRWRHWSRQQRPHPVKTAVRSKPQATQWPLRPVRSGPCSLSVSGLVQQGALPLVLASADSQSASERILALKEKAHAHMLRLADELKAAGHADAASMAAVADSLDFRRSSTPDGTIVVSDDLSQAMALLDNKQFEEAISALRPLESGGASGAVRYGLAVASGALGRPSEAADWFQMAADAGAEAAALRLGLGAACWEKGDREKAVKQLRAAVTMDPLVAEAHAALGEALAATGELDAARDALDDALALEPDLPLARSALGTVLYEKGDFTGASYELGRAAAADEGNPDLLYNHAAALSAAGKWDDVVSRAAGRASESGDPQLSRIVADAFERKGRAEEARKYLSASAKAEDGATDAQLRLARSLREDGKLDEALQAATAAAKSDPRSAAALVEMGAALEAQGRQEDALHHYRTAIGIDRSDAGAAVGAGRVLIARGQAKEALSHLKQAAALPDAPAEALYWLGLAHLATNKPLLAIEALRQASMDGTLKALDLPAYLGRAYLAAGRHKEAAEELRRAKKLAPEIPEINRDLGYALHRLRSYDEARRSLQAYLDAAPEAADAAEVKRLVQSL